jgi:hypothetical protein
VGRLPTARQKVYTRAVIGLPELFIILVVGLIVLAGTGFWIWMLIDCVTKEPDSGNTKICWTLIIVFAHFVGALIYFFARRDQRLAEVGR